MKESKLQNILFILFNIVLAIALVLGLYVGLYKLRLVSLPQFLENIINHEQSNNNKVVIPGDDGKIYESLKNNQNSSTVSVQTNLTKDNIKQLLSGISTNTNYYWEANVKLFSGKDSLSTKLIVRHHNGLFRVESYDKQGRLIKLAADNKKELKEKIYDLQSEKYTIKSYATGSMSLFAEAGVPDIKSFIDYGDSEKSVFSLINSDLGTLLSLEFENNYKGYTHRELYFISLDYGIPVRAETYENDKLIYLCETTALTSLEAPSEDVFTIK